VSLKHCIGRGSPVKAKGKFPSLKLNRTVCWQTLLERDFIYLLEFDPNVLSYKERPFSINNASVNLRQDYVPGFLVERPNKKQVIEVRVEEQAKENTELYRSIASVCCREGYEFLVVTESKIRVQPLLDNIKLLWRYAITTLSPQHQILCLGFMNGRLNTTFRDAVRFFESENAPKQVVYALIYWGLLSIDLMKPINADTLVYLPKAATMVRKVS
jgi:hypothetical protein